MARKRIGELLVERGAITPEQLEEGLAHHKQARVRLGVALIQKGFLSEEQLIQALGQALNIPQVDLKATQPEWSAIHMLRARFCEQHDLFPFALVPGQPRKQLLVALSDPLNVAALEEIEFTTGLKVAPRLATLSQVRAAILRYYHKVNPDDAAEGTATVIHSRAGGGTITLQKDSAPPVIQATEEDVIVGELVEAEPKATGDLLDDLFAPAPKSSRPPPLQPRPPKGKKTPVDLLRQDLDYLFGKRDEQDSIEQLEKKFWTLLTLMESKGLISREEFARALEARGED